MQFQLGEAVESNCQWKSIMQLELGLNGIVIHKRLR